MEKEMNIQETLKLIFQKLDNQDILKLILKKLDYLENEVKNARSDYEKRITSLEDNNDDLKDRIIELEDEVFEPGE